MSSHDDLDWLAHRYLLDELSAEEAAAFEDRLGSDEEAAAALSRGVVLLGAITEAVQPSHRRKADPAAANGRQRRIAGLVAVAATIALVCVLGVSQSLTRTVRVPASDAVELVSLWRESTVDSSFDGESPFMDDDMSPGPDDVPDWLMAAVALDASQSDDEILEN